MNNKTLQRFIQKVELDIITGCWDWKSRINNHGYGVFGIKNKNYYSHRLSYEYFKEEIPKNTELDHLCKNTKCCNPEHLEAVSHKENIFRSNAPTTINHFKTHCIRGHEFTPENTLKIKGTGRNCKKCRSEANKIWCKNNRPHGKQRKVQGL